MSGYQNNSIFWVEVEKIGANPFQPRRDFEQKPLEDLADSIRQYGVLQPLVVTRKEEENENGVSVYYELIAGERRLRAARIAGLKQVPVIIRKETDDKIKLELAIIENLQREDLNPIDRALAFEQLYKEFKLTHAEIGKKMGKSRVYVSNSLRLLSLPDNIKQGLMNGNITEGHTRPLLMLSDRPEEQETLYKEITLKKMSVRESEKVARSIAQDRVRKKKFVRDPRIRDYEKRLSDNLGTRVQIEQKEKGGKITIDYFTVDDLESILNSIKKVDHGSGRDMMDNYMRMQEEEISKKNISQSGPIDFMANELGTNNQDRVVIEDFKKDDPIDFPHEEKEVVEYMEELPEYKPIENHEITDGSFYQDHQNHSFSRDNYSQHSKEDSFLQRNFTSKSQEDDSVVQWNDTPTTFSSEAYHDNYQASQPENNSDVLDNYVRYSHSYEDQQPNNTVKKRNFIDRMFN